MCVRVFAYACVRACMYVRACTCVRACVHVCVRDKAICSHVTLRPSGSEALGVLHVTSVSVSPSLAVFSMLPGHLIVGGLLVTYTIVGESSGLHKQNVMGAKAVCHVP